MLVTHTHMTDPAWLEGWHGQVTVTLTYNESATDSLNTFKKCLIPSYERVDPFYLFLQLYH